MSGCDMSPFKIYSLAEECPFQDLHTQRPAVPTCLGPQILLARSRNLAARPATASPKWHGTDSPHRLGRTVQCWRMPGPPTLTESRCVAWRMHLGSPHGRRPMRACPRLSDPIKTAAHEMILGTYPCTAPRQM